MALLQAFGKIKAFHLVKESPEATSSKGYCFVEYADPAITPVAVNGLNGMDLGGGKVLTARVAAQRTAVGGTAAGTTGQAAPSVPGSSALPEGANIVAGYDVEELVDAAMGQKPMPTVPKYLDHFGVPVTRITTVVAPPIPRIPTIPNVAPIHPIAPINGGAPAPVGALPPGASALDIANAALSALNGAVLPVVSSAQTNPTRILVLSNMVTDEDLATDEEYNGLKDEVEEEVRKFGKLISLIIPRPGDAGAEPSAIRKIFLEYATVQDATNAERELSGRQFGPMVVETSYFDETEFGAKRLK